MPEPTFPLDGYRVARLTPEHAPELQDLYERCTDYHEIHDGTPTPPDAGEAELRATPPGRSVDDKLPFGIYSPGGEMVGYLELFRDYPGEGEWWIGLLLIDPEARSRGLGSRIYRSASTWAAANGARCIQLGALGAQPGAERFWRRQGFRELRRQPYASRAGARSHTLIVMRHDLATGEPASRPTRMHPSLGLESGTVRVVPYDPAWPALFAAEAERITAALAPRPLHLEHTGSTSVPGLAAKPIIDLLAGRPPGEPAGPYVEALSRAGYVHRGEQGIPGRDFFRRGEPRAYHLHLVETGSAFWRDHLRFRDALRSDASTAAAYGRLKQELAGRFPRDREAYIEGKGPFVLEVLRRAAERERG